MDVIEAKDKFNKFSEKKPELFKKAYLLTRDCLILAKIYDNLPLFSTYSRSNCEKYSQLIDALFNLKPDSVLIYFAEINLYGLFTPEDYATFCRNIANKIEEDGIYVNVYQLVLSEQKQKLVFMCTEESYYEKMQKYATDCFNSAKIQQSCAEICVDFPCNGDNEIIAAYNKLYNFIRERGDIPCCESMKQIQLLQKHNYSYREYSCNDTLTARTIDELTQFVRSIPSSSAPQNLVINITNGPIINNFAQQKIDKNHIARDWIVANPPGENESTSEYYQKYKNVYKDGLTIQKFTSEVITIGYKKLHGKINYWTKS